MCNVLELSKSGYYAWCHRPTSPRTQENEQLSQQIQVIHKQSRKTYGAPRIHAALKDKGFQVGRHRVARLMSQQGICVRPRRRFRTTTDSNHPFPIAENLLNRDFTTTEPDKAWVADISVPQQRRERWEYGLPQSAYRSRLQTTISGFG
jgi:transposase InsO family protein